jgi:sugar phosphate isomerase/epimerase
MRLCFDATRFGSGLQEAVSLAVEKQLGACEFCFEKFDTAEEGGRGLSAAEKGYLNSVAEFSRDNNIEIAALKLKTILKVSDRNSLRDFKAMIGKLAAVAGLLSCKRLLFYLQGEPSADWLTRVETALNPVVAGLKKKGLTLVLSLSTPSAYLSRSLRSWRAIEPDEWRALLAGIPGLGLSFSVADCAWQGIDYLRILSSLAPAIEHVEAQDVQVNRQIIAENGLFGPLWWRYMTVGKGQIDWAQFVEALKLYDYAGSLSIHFEDEFASEGEGLFEALETSIKVLAPLVKY